MHNKHLRSLLLAALSCLAASLHAASSNWASCTSDCRPSAEPSVSRANETRAEKSAPQQHPLKGVVTDIVSDQSALMVKHEAIPGVMKAMTMLFVVDSSALSSVKKGDAITGLLHSDTEGTWRLDDVKVTAPAK